MFSDICKRIIASGEEYTWPQMEKYLTENFGFWEKIKLSERETDSLKELFNQVFVKGTATDEKSLYNNFNAFARQVYSLISKKAAVGWTTGAHTGNPVPIYSVGVGSKQFGKFQNNTEIPGKILKIAGY